MHEHLMKYMGTVIRCSNLYRERRLAGTGVGGNQVPYVLVICRNPGVSQDKLAQQLNVNRSSVTRQLGPLEKNGLITRSRCESDRRIVRVYPTERMQALLPQVRAVLADWSAALTGAVSQEELGALTGLMARLSDRARELV